MTKWPAEDVVKGCQAEAVASLAIMGAAHEAPYATKDGTAKSADIAFWDRVAKEAPRIAAWVVQGLTIVGRAE
jgi:hypothetical protein